LDNFTSQCARGQSKGRYAFVSLGCPKNLVDSERMLGLLQLDGYELVNDPSGADFAVVNRMVRGLLVWGGLMTLAMYAMLLVAERRHGLHLDSAWPLVPVFCLPAGAFWALISWHWNEYLFRKLGFDKGSPKR
jgi:hypothetical protein